MTKKEIARLVYNNTQLSLVDSQDAVQATFEAIAKLLVKYGRVELRGFGVFTVQKRAARKAHNPRTGEDVKVKAHETVVFKPSKLMKADIQARRATEKSPKKATVNAKKTVEKDAVKAPVKAPVKKASKKTAK